MIRRVHIKHFRCIEDADFTLDPLTILVGPNGSGKSTILRALQPFGAFSRTEYWRHQVEPDIQITSDKNPWNYQSLRLDLEALRRPNPVTLEKRELRWDGGNLTNLIDSLAREEQEELSTQYCRLVPSFASVGTVAAEEVGQKQLRFQDKWDRKVWYSPNEVADGSILVLAFMLLQYQDPPPDVLAIEEPERGLHPYLLGELIKLFRNLSQGTWGKPIQIVAATHSAELVEFAKPEEVRFVNRNSKDGRVAVTEVPLSTEGWKKGFEEYGHSLGSLWLSGNLGGVPSK